jgi:poly(A) polymerase
MEEEIAIQICSSLQRASHEAVFAGGFVRDMLMNKKAHDIDIATSAPPETVAYVLKRNYFFIKEVGKAFGVVLAKKDDFEFEIATFRTEQGYSDGRHPDSVKFSSMREDAQRRDLTINALFFDPIEKRVIDYVNGQDDINKGIIRFVGNADERIAEDKLRMLRAIRFALKLNFAIEPSSFQAIKAHSNEISIISPERINQELTKMIECGQPSKMYDLFTITNLMQHIFPEMEKLYGLTQDPEWHPEGATVRKITYLE